MYYRPYYEKAGGYYLECRNNKFSKKVQTFYNLKEYAISLVKELIYIDDIECNYLQNEIDYSTFNQDEFCLNFHIITNTNLI